MEQPYPGGSNLMRQAFMKRGASSESADILLQSLSDSSIKQYNSYLKRWWNFCNNSGKNPFSESKQVIVKFLTQEFNRGVAHGTLNGTKSAIALLVGSHIAYDEDVKLFLKGAFYLRPDKPKYNETWDPSVVLNVLASWDTAKIAFDTLSQKLVTLIALVTGQRMQTLSLIKIKNIRVFEEKVEIKITDRIKTTKKNTVQPILTLPFYHSNKNICAAHTLQK